jgi:hypothetical protein
VDRVEDTTDMRFWIWIPGSHLVEHPRLLQTLPRLAKDGIMREGVHLAGKPVYRLVSWHVYADSGPLKGEEWYMGGWKEYFLVQERHPRPKGNGPKDWYPEISGRRTSEKGG